MVVFSFRDLILLGEETYASVQCQIVELGPITDDDRPRRTISVTDVSEEGEAAQSERCLAEDNGVETALAEYWVESIS